MKIRAVITDMDNTLYSWVDYIVPAVEAMVSAICRTLALPRIQVVQALKEVYERYESNEYPFALQESRLFDPFRGDFDSFNALVIGPAREAFATARRKYLRPYRGVEEALAALDARGIPVVALTDAPRNPAERRMRSMKLDPWLTALYTLPAFPFPESGVDEEILKREEGGGLELACPVFELPREAEKPAPQGFRAICAFLGVEPGEVAFIGDSLTKDMRLAREEGALDCWAEYGTYVSLEYQERLSTISAPAAMRRHLRHAPDPDHLPSVRLSCFSQIVDVIEAQIDRRKIA